MPVDYSMRMRCAEELAAAAIDELLTEGGHMLWQAYLQRKAFPFSAETATDALVSNVLMCFVPHDAGPDEAPDEDWDLEEEPVPGVVDSWARMHLDVRRKRDLDENLPKVARPDRRFNSQRARNSDANRRANRGDKRDKIKEEKTFDLKEEVQLDEEEEKLRDARQQEEAKRRERENKVRSNEKAKEAEVQRVQALHEEMSRKPHTFDSEGGLIWVEELKFDRMPKTQEIFVWNVKKDPHKRMDLDGSSSLKKTDSPAQKKQQQSRGRKTRFGDRSSKAQRDEDDFPDGFSKLQHGQPPILETMVVKPGVLLVSHGKPKPGPAVLSTGCGMSRKEYVALSEKEQAYESHNPSTTDPSGHNPQAGDSPDSPQGATSVPGSRGVQRSGSAGGFGNAPTDPQSGETALDSTLPPISTGTDRGLGNVGGGPKKGATGNRTGSAGLGGTGSSAKAEGESRVQMAPTAPSHFARAKKMEAVGHLGRPPRLHVAPLGGPYGYGVAQPPLGATMGHGLHRHQSTKEAYFFPDPKSEMLPLLRSTSEASFAPKRRSPRPASTTPSKNASREDSRAQTAPGSSIMEDIDSPSHGLMRADTKSNAYRVMRQALFPNTLNSSYVAGM